MLKFFHLVLHARQIDFEPLQVLAIRLHLFVVDALLAVLDLLDVLDLIDVDCCD